MTRQTKVNLTILAANLRRHDVKLNLAILIAGAFAQVGLLTAGCYWFAFRHVYRGYFLFALCVLLFGLVFNSFVMLRSGTQKVKFNGSEVKLNGR
jgi:hypothetical protein